MICHLGKLSYSSGVISYDPHDATRAAKPTHNKIVNHSLYIYFRHGPGEKYFGSIHSEVGVHVVYSNVYCMIPPEDGVVNDESLVVVIRPLRCAAFVFQKPCHGEVDAAH